jgi:hypothetical protein
MQKAQGPAQVFVGPCVGRCLKSCAEGVLHLRQCLLVPSALQTTGALAARPAHEHSPAIATLCGGHPAEIVAKDAAMVWIWGLFAGEEASPSGRKPFALHVALA